MFGLEASQILLKQKTDYFLTELFTSRLYCERSKYVGIYLDQILKWCVGGTNSKKIKEHAAWLFGTKISISILKNTS
jgi:hypothetical protein